MSSMFPAPMMAGRYHVTTMAPGVDGTGITTAEKTQLVNDVAGMRANVDVMAALRFDPDHPNYGAVRGPVSAAQRTANTVAINLAAADAKDANGTLVIKGSYEVDGTINTHCHVDAGDGSLTVYDQSISPVFQIGTPTTTRMYSKSVHAPAVIQGAKTNGTGWIGEDIGVRVSNVYNCQIFLQEIQGFKRGLVEHADGPHGNVYNTFFLGFSNNNYIGLDIEATNSGWVNQNEHFGGWFYIHSSEGELIPGSRHVRIERVDHSSDNMTFTGASLEGQGAEYALEHGGRWNSFINCRWEIRGTLGPRILGLEGSHSLLIDGGYYSEQITIVGPSPQSEIRSGAYTRRTNTGYPDGMNIYRPTSSPYPAITIMPGGADADMWANDTATAWRWRFSANAIEGKGTADTQPRVRIPATGAQIQMGPGNAAADTYLVREGAGHMRTGGGTAVFEAPIMKIGSNYYWTDSAGMLRKHTAKPPGATSTSVGTVIG